jgi:predicted ATPase
MSRYVLTGGPCVGKTTVLQLLTRLGFPILTETAREVIEEQAAICGTLVPWIHPKEFQEAVAWRQWKKETFTIHRKTIFLDRGIIDGCGYAAMEEVPVPRIIDLFGRNRYDRVFLLAPLPFYENDESRKEDREFGSQVSEEIRKAYIAHGYEVITVPFMAPEERVGFILDKL